MGTQEQHAMAVDRSLASVEVELARARKLHKAGARRLLTEARKLRTARLEAEVGGGKVHVKPHLKSKPKRRQQSFDLVMT